MDSNNEGFTDFFQDKYLLRLTDMLAKRYGKTPYEILTEMTIREFSFNISVMLIAMQEENEDSKGEDKLPSKDKPKGGWGSIGIKRIVKEKEK